MFHSASRRKNASVMLSRMSMDSEKSSSVVSRRADSSKMSPMPLETFQAVMSREVSLLRVRRVTPRTRIDFPVRRTARNRSRRGGPSGPMKRESNGSFESRSRVIPVRVSARVFHSVMRGRERPVAGSSRRAQATGAAEAKSECSCVDL